MTVLQHLFHGPAPHMLRETLTARMVIARKAAEQLQVQLVTARHQNRVQTAKIRVLSAQAVTASVRRGDLEHDLMLARAGHSSDDEVLQAKDEKIRRLEARVENLRTLLAADADDLRRVAAQHHDRAYDLTTANRGKDREIAALHHQAQLRAAADKRGETTA